MANYATVADLKADALARAGELTDGSSAFETLVLQYLNRAMLGLVTGGPFGTLKTEPLLSIPVIDWEWARAYPPGSLILTEPITPLSTTLTHDSTLVTHTVSSQDFTNWFLKVPVDAQVVRIASQDTPPETECTLQSKWIHTTRTALNNCVFFQGEYDLAADFIRFIDSPRITLDPYFLPVVDVKVLENDYPLTLIDSGVPRLAALVQPRKLRFSHYLDPDQPFYISYEYMKKPTDLSVGGTDPPLPITQRPLLSLAAGVLIAADKQDDRAINLASELRSMLSMYSHEEQHQRRRRSPYAGQMRARQDQLMTNRRRILSYEVP